MKRKRKTHNTHDTQPLSIEPQQPVRGRKWRVLAIIIIALLILVTGLGLWDSRSPMLSSGCHFDHQQFRGEEFSISLFIWGERKQDVVADLYRSNDIDPLPVAHTDLDVFIGTDVPYLAQRYKLSLTRPGEYLVKATLDDLRWSESYHFVSGRHGVAIGCN